MNEQAEPLSTESNDAGEIAPLPAFEISEDLMHTSCYGKEGQFIAVRTVRTPDMASPDGRSRVYGQVTAIGGPDERFGTTCSNTFLLYLQDSKDSAPRLIVTKQVGDYKWNGARLIDWSPDSRNFLFEYRVTSYGDTDYVGYSNFLYDTLRNETVYIKQHEIFNRHIGRDCEFNADATGFDERGRIVFKAPGKWVNDDPCIEEGVWAVDHKAETVTQLADDFVMPQHGNFETLNVHPVIEISDDADTLSVTCWKLGDNAGPPGSRFGRSRVFKSPDGRFSAYVDVFARLVEQGIDRICKNESTLYISGLVGENYKIVKSLKPFEAPRPYLLGNGMRIIEWSSDGRYLLLVEERWLYTGERWSPLPVVFDTSEATFLESDIHTIVPNRDKCNLTSLETLKFAEAPQFVVKASWHACVDERNMGEDLWLVDPVKETGALLSPE